MNREKYFKMTLNKKHISRAIISGGGTGGHIFPAIAIANEIKSRNTDAEILFVGSIGKMEMTRVPDAGYEIIGLPISGFQRKLTLSNFLLPFKILISLIKARKVIKKFAPEIVIGVGGYASGPTLKMATLLGIPTLIQEQNSYPGKTNIILSKKVNLICAAYDGLEKFFPADKIKITGNPIRKELSQQGISKNEALKLFDLSLDKKTILVLGGSLGAKTLNDSVLKMIHSEGQADYQFIWQCGKYYFEQLKAEVEEKQLNNIKLVPFISRMDAAYAAADVIISRAGALSVSELCLVGKPVVLVPSPNVSEDHQTKNAMFLVGADAALLVKDSKCGDDLIKTAKSLVADSNLSAKLSKNISALAKPNATSDIVDESENIIKK